MARTDYFPALRCIVWSTILIGWMHGCQQPPTDTQPPPPPPDNSETPTLASIQADVFDLHCLGCHGSANPAQGLDLSPGKALDSLLYRQSLIETGFNLVQPGDPDNSLLVQKLEGSAATESMPYALPRLPKHKTDAVRNWVAGMATTQQRPTLGYLQTKVFNVNCALSGCHNAATKTFGVDLSPGKTLASLYGIPARQSRTTDLLEPGDPDNSYLIQKLEGSAAGSQMPFGSTPLAQQQIDIIRTWITSLQPPQPNIAWIQEYVFNVSCATGGCHARATPENAQLDLSAYRAADNLINITSSQIASLQRVKPGDAANSYLVQKMLGAPTIVGAGMPALGNTLTQEKIDAVRTWINNLPVQ